MLGDGKFPTDQCFAKRKFGRSIADGIQCLKGRPAHSGGRACISSGVPTESFQFEMRFVMNGEVWRHRTHIPLFRGSRRWPVMHFPENDVTHCALRSEPAAYDAFPERTSL